MKKIPILLLLLVICFSGCAPSANYDSLTDDMINGNTVESNSNVIESSANSVELYENPTSKTLPGYTGITEYKDVLLPAPTDDSMQEFAQKRQEIVDARQEEQPVISNIKDFESEFYWIPTIDNETDIGLLSATQVVEIEDAWYSERESVGYAMTCYDAYREFGSMTFLRTVDEYNAYTVYDVCGGGHLYVYFTNKDMPYYKSLKIDYVPKEFSLKDLQNIQIGDSIDKVIEIDPSVEKYKNVFDTYYCHTTTHVVKEGLYIIDYEKIDGEIVVSNVELCEDSVYRRGIGYGDMYEDRPVQMKLLPQDYPPAS